MITMTHCKHAKYIKMGIPHNCLKAQLICNLGIFYLNNIKDQVIIRLANKHGHIIIYRIDFSINSSGSGITH